MEITMLQAKLQQITKDSPAEFGIMTPQHMVEHLILTFKLSQGKIPLPDKDPSPKALAAKQAILYGNVDIPRGIRAPGLEEGQLLELRHSSLEESKSKLFEAIGQFHSYFELNKDLKHQHPVFGKLDYQEWWLFHQKHFKHHFGQFGVVL